MRTAATLAALGFLLTGAFFNGATGQTGLTPSGDAAPMPAVRLFEIGALPDAQTRTFFGRVAARDTVKKSFEITGRVTDIPVREGERIAAGDVIARIDPEPLERAVRRALIEFQKAERDEARLATLVSRNVASAVSAEDARTARELASVALADARAALEDAVLTAPFDAIVAERLIAPFTNVEVGEPVLALHDMSEVLVKIDVPERVLAQAGDPNAIDFFVTNGDGRLKPLNLAEFEAQTGTIGQSFELSLRLPPLDDALLIPGASKTVTAQMPNRALGRRIPAGAVLSGPDRNFFVMVFQPGEDGVGTVTRQPVSVSAPTGTGLRVEGLDDGTLVIAAGGHLLSDGQMVRRYNGLVVEEE